MCNAKALIAVVAIGAAVYTGGASLGLLGAAGGAGAAGAGAAAAGAGVAAGAGAAAAGAGAAAAGAGAGAVSAGLTTAQAVNLGLSAAGALAGATSAYQGAQTAKSVAQANANTAEQNAQDAIRRGDKDAASVRRQSQQVVGAQRAALSARGLDVSEGTPADLIDQTDFFGQSDAATTRTNARREAFAYRSQQAGFQAESASASPWLSGGGALLGGAGSVADKWYRYSGKGVGG